MIGRAACFRSLLLASCALTTLPALADDEASGGSGPSEEVIVQSTILRSKQESLDLMRQADNVKDVTLEDEIRRLPDANIAEALQRIPGISMESDSGSGRFVNIRGFDGDLNGSFWEGVHLTANNQNASPMGGGRAVAYDVFPAGLVGGLEVVKSTTPAMDAEGIGGQVNMLGHKLPIGGKPFLEADFGGGIESLRNSPVWQGSLAAGTSFGLDQHEGAPTPFRLIVALAYHEDRRGIDDVEEDYTGGGAAQYLALYDLQNRWYEYHRVTQGGSAELDYDPSTNFGLYAKAMSSGYWESATKHELIVKNLDGSDDGGSTFTDLGNGHYLASNARATQRFIDTSEHITSTLLTGGGHYDFGAARIDLRGGYVEGTDSFPHSYTIDFNSNSNFAVSYQDADPSHRTETLQTPGASLTDPSQFSLARVRNQTDHAFDREYSAGGDLSVPLTLLGPDDEAKVGGQARLRSRGYDETDFSGSPTGTLPWSQFAQGSPQIYYNSWYNIGPQINHEQALGAVPETASYNSGAFARGTEDVYAGYGQYSATLGRFSLIGGVRVEKTDRKQSAYLFSDTSSAGSYYTTTDSYTNIFPSLQGKFQLTSGVLLRAAYSTGIARPGFNQTSAATQVSFANQTVSSGNPTLKPQTDNAVDLGADVDLPGGGTAGVGLFYKDFSNYIVTRSYFGSFQGQNGFFFSGYLNLPSTRADGIELRFDRPLNFLPHPFDGLGIDGNYTFVDSSAQIRPGEKKVRLPQTSPENYNLGLYYDKGPFYARIAASYVSANLWAIGGDRTTDIFSQGRFRMDLGVSYQLTSYLQAYFDAKDLTNTKLQFTQGSSPDHPIQREFYDSDYLGGVRVKF